MSTKLSKYIDHTLLKPEASVEDIKKLCAEAKQYDFMSVCVNPCFVPLCKTLLEESDVKVCTVIGFPLGATTTATKCFEATEAINNGANEIDMVINVGKLKEKDFAYVVDEIKALKNVCGKDIILKVIIETCLLTDEEKINACRCVIDGQADFVKTSTGFSKGGATIADVTLLKQSVGDKALVKASGGIRTKEDFQAMIKAGANRIGTSKGCELVK